MSTPRLDKRARAALFRDRLAHGLQDRGLSQAALARATGVDRSTLSQLLAPDSKRLPNAQFAAEAASALGLSADWLLGLTDRPEAPGDLVDPMTMPQAPRALIDDLIVDAHRAADGLKIRHVPAGLPDILKTPAMLRWEAAPAYGAATDAAVIAAEQRLADIRAGRTDHDISLPRHELVNFLHGTGLYADCPPAVRREQADRLAVDAAALYPRVRISLFDGRVHYAAPVTIFGTVQALIYVGQNYLVFRDRDRVAGLTRHFDQLVRDAIVPDHQFPAFVQDELRRTTL
jgi:transcriptional regulator with XRE-family HTH domain